MDGPSSGADADFATVKWEFRHDQCESAWILVGCPDGSNRRGAVRCRYLDPCEIGALRLDREHYPLSVYQRSLIHSDGLPMAVSRISVGADIRRAVGLHPPLRRR
jgi:hypothetical protein